MNIALVAMSGIRACDAELLRLGLTLPGFVERSKTIASLPSLGLLTLAGMTPAPHQCQYIEIEDLRKLPVQESLPDGFDLVAISSFSAQIGEAYELADRYRAEGVPVVLGGLHVTALPEEAAEHCDAVVVGEGEAAWPDVLRDAEAGRLKRFYRSDGEFSLAEAPMPAFELLDWSQLQPPDRAGQPGMPAPLPVLRQLHPPDPAVQAEAGRPGPCRDRPHPQLVAAPLPGIRRRQRLRQQAVLVDAVDGVEDPPRPLVRRDRSVGTRRRRAADAAARERLCGGPHRPGEPRGGRAGAAWK